MRVIDVLRRIRDIEPIYRIYIRSVGIPIQKYKRYKEIQNFREHGLKNMKEFIECGETLGIKCYCIFGTLLGVVREKNIIEHDYDIDLAVNTDEEFRKLETVLLEKGYKKRREFVINNKIDVETWMKNGVAIDLYVIQEDEKGNYFNTIWRFPGVKYKHNIPEAYRVMYHRIPRIKSIVSTDFQGFHVYIPTNAEEIVASIYGDNWRTPDPSFEHHVPEEKREMVIERVFG